jgi:hypothetical protein
MQDKFLKWKEIVMQEFNYLNYELSNIVFNDPNINIEEFEDKGVIAFFVFDNFLHQKEFQEVFMYLKPEHRTLSNLNRFLEKIEKLAKKNNCSIIKIGSNSGYKDQKFINYLRRKAYKTDSVMKEL